MAVAVAMMAASVARVEAAKVQAATAALEATGLGGRSHMHWWLMVHIKRMWLHRQPTFCC